MSLITILSEDRDNYQFGGATATIRIFANQTFLTSTSIIVDQGNIRESLDWFAEIDCTVAGTVLSIPSFDIHSTNDSNNQRSTYTAILYDSTGKKVDTFLANFQVPYQYGSSLNWSSLYSYGQHTHRPYSAYFSASDFTSLITAIATTKHDRIQFKNAGANLGAVGTASSVDFTGGGVTASRVGDDVTVSIPGAIESIVSNSTELDTLITLANANPSNSYNAILDALTIISVAKVVPDNVYFEFLNGAIFVNGGGGSLDFEGLGLVRPESQQARFSGFAPLDVIFSGSVYPYRLSAALWDNANWAERAQCAIDAIGPTKFVHIDVNEGGTWIDPIILEEKTVLKMAPGVFPNDCNVTPNITQKDNSVWCGSGKGITTVYCSTDIGDDPTGTGAFGWYDFAANPANNDVIVFNGVTFTFKTTPAGGTDVQIGSGATGSDTNLGITIDNLITVLNASGNGSISVATYTDNHTASNKDGTRVRVVYDTLGNAGKAYMLTTVHANISRSDPTLVGSERPLLRSLHTGDGLNNQSMQVFDMTIKGQETGVTCYSAFSSLLYGNGRDLFMHDLAFDHTHNFHAYIGVFSAGGAVPDSCGIYNLEINGTMTQSVGFLMGRNIFVDNITWDDIQWHPMSPSGVLVDIEPNTAPGVVENCRITNLLADGRTAQQVWGLVACQGIDQADERHLKLSNLQAIGGEAFDYVYKDANVDLTNNKVYLPGHSLKTATKIWLDASGGSIQGGLTSARYYWVIVDSVDPDDYIKFAENYWMAKAGNAVDITSASGGGRYTVTLFGSLDTGVNVYGVSHVQASDIQLIRCRSTGFVARNAHRVSATNIDCMDCGGNGSPAFRVAGVANSSFALLKAQSSGGIGSNADQTTLLEDEFTPSSPCNTAGTAIHVPSGGVRRWWEGKTVTINSVDRVVDQYVDAYNFTVTTSAGTNTGVSIVTKFSSNDYALNDVETLTLNSAGTSKEYSRLTDILPAAPSSVTDNAIPRWNGTNGRAIQNSLVTLDDSGSITIPDSQGYKSAAGTLIRYDGGGGKVEVGSLSVARTDINTSGAIYDNIGGNLLCGTTSGGKRLVSTAQYQWTSSSNDPSTAADVGVARVAALVMKVTDGSTELGWIQDAGHSRVTGDVTNATTTMANITGLSAPLRAGQSYVGRLVLLVSDDVAADGCKFDFDGGTATVTDFRAMGKITDTVSIRALAMTTALATDFVDATTTGSGLVEIEFTITCNAAGTFIPRFAQNAHTTGTLTAFRGCKMELTDTP